MIPKGTVDPVAGPALRRGSRNGEGHWQQLLITEGEVMNCLTTNGGFLGKKGRAATHDRCVASNSLHVWFDRISFERGNAFVSPYAFISAPSQGHKARTTAKHFWRARRLSASRKSGPRSRTSYPKNHMFRTCEDTGGQAGWRAYWGQQKNLGPCQDLLVSSDCKIL